MSLGYPAEGSWARREIERLEEKWRFASNYWSGIIELAEMQARGEITHLQYLYNKNSGLGDWVFRFIPTDTFDFSRMINFIDDYLPDQWEERRRWHTWGHEPH